MRLGLLVALLVLPTLARAQDGRAVQTAREAVRAQVAFRGGASADLADLEATDVVTDARTGATFVYLVQRYAGIDVWGTTTPVAVDARGEFVLAGPAAFERGIASRASAPEPTLTAEVATARAEAHVQRLPRDGTEAPVSDSPGEPAMRAPAAYEASDVCLVYQPVEGGALRLAWAVTLAGGSELWAVRVDAQTGAVLAADDLVYRDTWSASASEPRSFAPLASEMAPLSLGASASGASAPSYRVFAQPTESPGHGAASLVVGPADEVASPRGWHDTGAAQYTITRGNNAYAYTDREPVADPMLCGVTPGCNQPDAGSSPDGGARLVFDTPFDAAQGVTPNAAAAVTSVFYWGNVVHDVTWRYGFDEAAGNFQTTNFGGQGKGADAVLLEALDGSGTDNANFSTPADGGPGRMQMYEWASVPLFEITAPASAARSYPVRAGVFGPEVGLASGAAVVVRTATGLVSAGCSVGEVGNRSAVAGSVAVIRRGACSFVDKARTAQALGASAYVVYNCDPATDAGCGDNAGEALVTMGCPGEPTPDPQMCSDVTLLGGFVANSTGVRIAESAALRVTLDRSRPSRDSDFDAGVVVHEYAHGVSNRLVGGPARATCLQNDEQMGEGWSDFFGLMLTQRPGATGVQPRGIGTYLNFEPTDGRGIRPAPYSTSFAVNDYTYQDVTSGARRLSVPHGVGFVWASILWDLTWSLVDAHGFSADIYGARGTAGNLIALNLVTTGLKLTPCSPGFVGGRDAIFAADRLLYPDPARAGEGQHYAAIWQAFARRGVGTGASEGLTSSLTDGTASFALPASVAAERTAAGAEARLDVAGANPFAVSTTLALTLGEPQNVRVEVLDLLGRRVALLHDGAAAGPLTLRLSAAGLPSGVYVVRASGEAFTLAQRVTVVR